MPIISGANLVTGWTAYAGNIWQASEPSSTSQVHFNGTHGTLETSTSTLTAANEWYWASSTLYVYSTSDPTTAYTSPGIEASVRIETLTTFQRNYLTIQNLQFQYTSTSTKGSIYINQSAHVILNNLTVDENDAFAGIYFDGSLGQGGYDTVSSSTIYNTRHTTDQRGAGILQDDPTGNDTITGNTIYGNTAEGIKVNLFNPSSNNTISNNTVYQNGDAGIAVNTSCTSTLVEYNLAYQNGQIDGDNSDIDLYAVGSNNIVAYNTVHDHHFVSLTAGGIVFDGGNSPGKFGSGNAIYGNLVYNEWYGIGTLNNPTSSGSAIYNNTVYNSTDYGIWIHGTVNRGTVVKNNIVQGAGTYLVWNEDAVSSTYANNDYYNASLTNEFNWNETTYSTLANWNTASGETKDISADSLFVSTSTNNFALASSSPAIDTGVNLGTIYQYALNPSSTWPSGVMTVNQNNQGSGWEIGAYAYPVPSVRSQGSPSSYPYLPYGTTSATLSLQTDKAATCKYGTGANVSYSSIASTFGTTGGTSHSQTLSGLQIGNPYTYYVRCSDQDSIVNPDDYAISFSVNGPSFSVPAFFQAPVPTSSLAVNTAATSSPSMPAVSVSSTAAMMSQLAALKAQLAALLAQQQLTSASPSIAPAFTRDLELWSTGSDVKNLQLFLVSENSGPAARKLKSHGATTVFGILTYNALKEFQASAGITPASGWFGPKTRAYLNGLVK